MEQLTSALGFNAGVNVDGDNNIDIGSGVQGVAGESNTIRIGDTDITDTFIIGESAEQLLLVVLQSLLIETANWARYFHQRVSRMRSRRWAMPAKLFWPLGR